MADRVIPDARAPHLAVDYATMRFSDRDEAARLLAAHLDRYRSERPLVLGVPRGAVPMARVIAETLGGDLDVVLVRKLRAPDQPELAIGAVDETGTVVKGRYFDLAPDDYVAREIGAQQEVLKARRRRYARAHAPIDPAGRVVILVDDGVATGASMEAAIHAIRARRPRAIVVAVGVAPTSTLRRLRAEADDVVCLHDTDQFGAVGQFYDEFSEVTDDDVVAALALHADASPPAATPPPETPR